MYLNGYYYKPIIYIDENLNLKKSTISIRRILIIYGNNKRETVYIYPSFAVKYCPFPLKDIQYIYTQCISKNIEPFDKIDDLDKIIESSASYENWIYRIEKTLQKMKFQEKWAKHFFEFFYKLIDTKSTNSYLNDSLLMIQAFVNELNLKIPFLNFLSYANYQLPFQ